MAKVVLAMVMRNFGTQYAYLATRACKYFFENCSNIYQLWVSNSRLPRRGQVGTLPLRQSVFNDYNLYLLCDLSISHVTFR